MMSGMLLYGLLAVSIDAAIAQNSDKRRQLQPLFNNPERDANMAMASADFSLRGVYGFTAVVPGIQGDYLMLRTKFRIIMIENTSDIIDDDPQSYNNLAERYASTYNRFVFSRLGCDPEHPLAKCKSYP
jgi:hypothetical protein